MTRPAEAGRGSTPTRSPWWVSLWRRLTGAYPGDFTGTPEMRYSPVPDGRPDPGEIVWTWVPFEENHRSGKDRPVLLVGRDGRWLLGLMLTTRSRSRVEEERGVSRRRWGALGTGSWDRQRRPSEVRVDRIVRIEPRRVRREGATLDADRFAHVAEAVRRFHDSGAESHGGRR
jgi:hypothetical protein